MAQNVGSSQNKSPLDQLIDAGVRKDAPGAEAVLRAVGEREAFALVNTRVEGKTHLHLAIEDQSPDLIRVFLRYGADPFAVASKTEYAPAEMLRDDSCRFAYFDAEIPKARRRVGNAFALANTEKTTYEGLLHGDEYYRDLLVALLEREEFNIAPEAAQEIAEAFRAACNPEESSRRVQEGKLAVMFNTSRYAHRYAVVCRGDYAAIINSANFWGQPTINPRIIFSDHFSDPAKIRSVMSCDSNFALLFLQKNVGQDDSAYFESTRTLPCPPYQRVGNCPIGALEIALEYSLSIMRRTWGMTPDALLEERRLARFVCQDVMHRLRDEVIREYDQIHADPNKAVYYDVEAMPKVKQRQALEKQVRAEVAAQAVDEGWSDEIVCHLFDLIHQLTPKDLSSRAKLVGLAAVKNSPAEIFTLAAYYEALTGEPTPPKALQAEAAAFAAESLNSQ